MKHIHSSKFTAEDLAVIGKGLAALGELGITLLLRDPLPVMCDHGPYRLYQWEVITRDDGPFDCGKFEALLLGLNSEGKFKPQVYSVEDYPTEYGNFTQYYITVFI